MIVTILCGVIYTCVRWSKRFWGRCKMSVLEKEMRRKSFLDSSNERSVIQKKPSDVCILEANQKIDFLSHDEEVGSFTSLVFVDSGRFAIALWASEDAVCKMFVFSANDVCQNDSLLGCRPTQVINLDFYAQALVVSSDERYCFLWGIDSLRFRLSYFLIAKCPGSCMLTIVPCSSQCEVMLGTYAAVTAWVDNSKYLILFTTDIFSHAVQKIHVIDIMSGFKLCKTSVVDRSVFTVRGELTSACLLHGVYSILIMSKSGQLFAYNIKEDKFEEVLSTIMTKPFYLEDSFCSHFLCRNSFRSSPLFYACNALGDVCVFEYPSKGTIQIQKRFALFSKGEEGIRTVTDFQLESYSSLFLVMTDLDGLLIYDLNGKDAHLVALFELTSYYSTVLNLNDFQCLDMCLYLCSKEGQVSMWSLPRIGLELQYQCRTVIRQVYSSKEIEDMNISAILKNFLIFQ